MFFVRHAHTLLKLYAVPVEDAACSGAVCWLFSLYTPDSRKGAVPRHPSSFYSKNGRICVGHIIPPDATGKGFRQYTAGVLFLCTKNKEVRIYRFRDKHFACPYPEYHRLSLSTVRPLLPPRQGFRHGNAAGCVSSCQVFQRKGASVYRHSRTVHAVLRAHRINRRRVFHLRAENKRTRRCLRPPGRKPLYRIWGPSLYLPAVPLLRGIWPQRPQL